MHFTIIKDIYNKPLAHIILDVKKLKSFLLKWGTKKHCPCSLILFISVIDILIKAIKLEKEMKEIEESKMYISVDVMILQIRNIKESKRKLELLIGRT